MNSKERVITALQHRSGDRVPIFMWFHPAMAQRFSGLLEIPLSGLNEVMANDVRQAWVNNNYAMEGISHEKDGEWHIDYWGIKWVRQYFFNQIAAYPLAGASPEEMRSYTFPTAHLDDLLRPMISVGQEASQYFIGCDVSPCAFEMYWRLRGMENTMTDLLSDPDLARHMLKGCVDFSITLAEKVIERYPLDWLWTGDDIASQQSMMISPKTWRALVKPELARIFKIAKEHHMWLAYHCCGAMRPIIPDLIELGMDVLNPVQGNCPGMDPLELKRDFGKAITFMGGLDTQDLLPNASAAQVEAETHRLIDAMTQDGGGYILAASHTIPPETPEENIFALYTAAGISRQEIFDRAANLRRRLESLDAPVTKNQSFTVNRHGAVQRDGDFDAGHE
jgi:uroporphyrinogen decarboxylase